MHMKWIADVTSAEYLMWGEGVLPTTISLDLGSLWMSEVMILLQKYNHSVILIYRG